uniref:Uncharacterized protein n=1 Tax=Arundo donax TaxID=35708 RepID=A0A0A9FCN3_ARUDO
MTERLSWGTFPPGSSLLTHAVWFDAIRSEARPSQRRSLQHPAPLDTPVGWERHLRRHMRLRDFPRCMLLDFMMREVERASAATAVILNTVDELEQLAFNAMRAVFPPIYTISPLAFLLE